MKKKRIMITAVILLFLAVMTASADTERDPLLDTAFSMLEEGNVFIDRYNELTHADVKAVYAPGMPYMFGGKRADEILKGMPVFNKRKCLENTHFYREGQLYIYGFDCSGYTAWIMESNGYVHPGSLAEVATKYHKYRNNYVYTTNTHCTHLQPDWSEVAATLKIGDLYVIKHGGRHVLMYIGTLADYGFTSEELPELADYLHYPLVIHCGPNPEYAARFEKFIAENEEKYGRCAVTDGGVNVSILGVPREEAPFHEHVQTHDYDYFILGDSGQVLTVYRTDDYSSYSWFRCDKEH